MAVRSQLDTATEAHQNTFTLDQNALGNLPIKDGDVLSALSSFVNPRAARRPRSSLTEWNGAMLIFRFRRFGRYASTTTRIRRNSQAR